MKNSHVSDIQQGYKDRQQQAKGYINVKCERESSTYIYELATFDIHDGEKGNP